MTDWRKSLERLEGAYSACSITAYRSDFALFATWCRQGRLRALPASAPTVVGYIDDERTRLKPSTLRRRLCAIRKIHRLLDHPDPTDNEDVDLAMRRSRRSRPGRPDQALGITADIRDRLLAACPDTLLGVRDKVLVSVGFDTLCRGGELAALSVEDFTPTADGRFTALVRRAKNDPDGAGRFCRLSASSSALLEEWVARTGITKGPLLRPVYGERALAVHLQRLTITRVLKKLAGAARLEEASVAQVSSHSLRVGAAQQLTMNGLTLLVIMRAGGWRSVNVVARYIENMDIDVWPG